MRSRAAATGITVGSAVTNDITFQNPSPVISSGRINTFCNDSALNLGTMVQQLFDVDYTQPILGTFLNDSLATDIDTTYVTTLAGNWDAAQDSHSAIQNYEYSIGTTAGATDIQTWNPTTNLNFTTASLSLIVNQQYFVNLRSTNGAGLVSSLLSSDGVVYSVVQIDTIPGDTLPSDTLIGAGLKQFEQNYLLCFPNPTTDFVQLILSHDFDGELYLLDASGKLIRSQKLILNKGDIYSVRMEQLPTGTYFIKLADKYSISTVQILKE
jgi:Secretion system C-terminal sorting domain